MEGMGKPSGLVRRGAIYYLRQRCPKRLQGPNSPAEISMSLRTASYAEGLERIDPMRLLIREMFVAAFERRPRSSSASATHVCPARRVAQGEVAGNRLRFRCLAYPRRAYEDGAASRRTPVAAIVAAVEGIAGGRESGKLFVSGISYHTALNEREHAEPVASSPGLRRK